MKTLKNLLIGLCIAIGTQVNAQTPWETSGNFANPGDFIGSTNDEFFDVHQNNVRRARFRNVNWPGYNGSPATPNASRMHFGINGNNQNPFSMMQLGYNIPELLRRPWMNVGTTYGAGQDIMHVGILQRPAGTNNNNIIDAVIAWGCNDDIWFPGSGPDNLRFLFLAPTSATASPGSAPEGLETMRITPWGNVGIGNSFTNALQPARRLNVFDNTNIPQFRLSQSLNADVNLGNKADFQISNLGNLHIRTSSGANQRTVAIGFLPGEASDPINTGALQTRLDVGGLTRIRQIPLVEEKNCLIVGTNVLDSEDNVLTRIDFPTTSDADCLVLNGQGEWVNVCDLSGDCRWSDVASTTVPNERDLITGPPQNDDCQRGKVGIGVDNVQKAKLEVRNLITRDRINTAIYGETDMNQEFQSFPDIFHGVYGATRNGAPGGTATACGVKGYAQNSRYQVGVLGESRGTTGVGIGVAGLSRAPGTGIGVYGEVFSNAGPVLNSAGYFVGGITTTGPPLVVSDGSVKTDVQEISAATEILLLLSPKTYSFKSPDNRPIPFDQGTRFGFIAQELKQILPQLVQSTIIPEIMDSTGFVPGTSVEQLGIMYTELIPILVAGFQEQTTKLDAQVQANQYLETQVDLLMEQLQSHEALISEMQSQMNDVISSFQNTQSKVNNCCGMALSEGYNTPTGTVELDQNFPNPFETETTINFSITRPAQIRLDISDSQGRLLDVLINNQHFDEGHHTVRWNSAAFSPGTYYYSLYANTELLTKKMIKR